MVAAIQIHEMSDATTGVNKSSGTIRFKDADNSTVDANNPLVIPAADSIYSYTKKLRAYMEAAPPNTQIDNLRWYTDGNNGFGTGITVTVVNLGVSPAGRHTKPSRRTEHEFVLLHQCVSVKRGRDRHRAVRSGG